MQQSEPATPAAAKYEKQTPNPPYTSQTSQPASQTVFPVSRLSPPLRVRTTNQQPTPSINTYIHTPQQSIKQTTAVYPTPFFFLLYTCVDIYIHIHTEERKKEKQTNKNTRKC